MQAATARALPPTGRERVENQAIGTLAEAGVNGDFINALPIAAGVFTLRQGELQVEVVNDKFYELSGCANEPASFPAKFRHYSEGKGGAFIRAFLADPAEAPDERTLGDGDGAILLMHSWPRVMPDALDEAIRRLRDLGATFVRVDELDDPIQSPTNAADDPDSEA